MERSLIYGTGRSIRDSARRATRRCDMNEERCIVHQQHSQRTTGEAEVDTKTYTLR
jgi:hypothetical protein